MWKRNIKVLNDPTITEHCLTAFICTDEVLRHTYLVVQPSDSEHVILYDPFPEPIYAFLPCWQKDGHKRLAGKKRANITTAESAGWSIAVDLYRIYRVGK